MHSTPASAMDYAKARELMSIYSEMEELIRLGAYRRGSDPKVDRAIAINPALDP